MDIVEEHQEALVKCGTTKGPFTIRLVRKRSPLGYDRAVFLFERGFYDHFHFFPNGAWLLGSVWHLLH